MGDKALIYKTRLEMVLQEIEIHLSRLEKAFDELSHHYSLPFRVDDFHKITDGDDIALAFTDQIIYRFAKAQDSMGAKLFKAFMLYQGENVDRPFLDILNGLEKIGVLQVDEWFELREIRNEIAHNYENKPGAACNIVNGIYLYKGKLKQIMDALRERIDFP